jgi:methylenetetrahydrofolate dehydrogenase (NADP+) / methenyltetrahydrofolate cyclohydrolase
MPGTILDGRRMSAQIRDELRTRVATLASRGVEPALSGFLVGDDPGSASYVRLKEKAAAEVGIRSEMYRLPTGSTLEELSFRVAEVSAQPDVHGVFVQLPLPAHIAESAILPLVPPEKDIDGFNPENVGRAWLGQDSFAPATPAGIVEMLSRGGYHNLRRRHAVIVNTDSLVGKPVAALLLQERLGANVTLLHPDTPDLGDFTRRADILIVAVDRPRFITADMVKDGVIAFDFGTNYIDDPSASEGSRLVGDLDFDAIREKAEAITPVPGGLGPMTVTMLLSHTVLAAERLTSRG